MSLLLRLRRYLHHRAHRWVQGSSEAGHETRSKVWGVASFVAGGACSLVAVPLSSLLGLGDVGSGRLAFFVGFSVFMALLWCGLVGPTEYSARTVVVVSITGLTAIALAAIYLI
ncbi:hypothetical protein [Kitasatospora sp. HPMI-4]|uniref:hypothetical protein n=1 Tax=Kitasatospora sp. HPMI-4 TaxID=3448443 RepID=UPI003F1B7ED6